MAKGQVLYQEQQELQPELVSMMKEEVGKARERRMPIIRAFEAVAERSGLKSNTIRNYYYRYIHAHEELRKNEMVSKKDDFNQEDAIGKAFTDQETQELMRTMLIAQAQGESVRGCANRISSGDKRVLIRLQNKYRSIIAREPGYVEELMLQMKSEGITCYNPYTRERINRTVNESLKRTTETDGLLIDWIGQFVSNMKNIRVASLNDLVKGLRDLSSLAAGHNDSVEYITKRDHELQELNNKMIILESSVDKERKEMHKLNTKFRVLMDVNKQFIRLPDSDKLSGLKDYVQQLQSFMQD